MVYGQFATWRDQLSDDEYAKLRQRWREDDVAATLRPSDRRERES